MTAISLIASLAMLQQAAAVPAEGPEITGPLLVDACTSPLHGAFDFWVGDWDVTVSGQETLHARSSIQRGAGGCAVLERWMPVRGTEGLSLNSVDMATGRWHQKWVGFGPMAVEFTGGPTKDGMVLTGLWPNVGGVGRNGLVRMTYTSLDEGKVRQHGQVSFDEGLNWETSFDLIYSPRKDDDK